MAGLLTISSCLAKARSALPFDLDQSRGKVTPHDRRFALCRGRTGAGADAGRTPLHLCRAGRHARGAGLDRARAARAAPGRRHRLGRRGREQSTRKSCARSNRSSTARRSTGPCAASSTGWRNTRCRRPAWWRACCCARRRPSTRNPGSRACSARCIAPDRMTDARARVLETAEGGLAWTRSGLAHAAGVSSTVIDGLRAQGVFETVMIPPRPVVAAPDSELRHAGADAGPERRGRRCCAPMSRPACFNVTLLDGVTGSGKTEVYFEAVAAALGQGKQVLILLPEIALTHAFLDRFQAALRRQAGRMAFRPAAAGCAKRSGGRWRKAACASSPAPARRCSCRSRSSA